MRWYLSDRADPIAKPIADRHYNRQNPESAQFAQAGGAVVLRTQHATAVWITSTPYARYVKHAWAGAWINSTFRNEHPPRRHRCQLPEGVACPKHLSSELIREAVAATLALKGDPPPLGLVTFVDTDKVRAKENPGACYEYAGFTLVGKTQGGLLAYQLLPEQMPEPCDPIGSPEALARVRRPPGEQMALGVTL
jgi:hypothetical protein